MFTVSILSLVISSSLFARPADICSQTASIPVPVIASYDPNDDPGKDLTPDPNDENHDKDLPANSPDDYLSGETYPQSGNDD